MNQLHNLLSDIRRCKLCEPELALGANPVVQANINAKILIAGQAPGTKVHKTGIPFNDASGDRLRQWLGVSKDQFYDSSLFAIVPMGFCYPGKGKSGDLPPRKECAITWRSQLLKALPNIELTLAIGQYAQQWHLPQTTAKNLTEAVKTWRNNWPHTIPLPHPSPRNNIWLAKNPWFEHEVIPILQKKVKELVK